MTVRQPGPQHTRATIYAVAERAGVSISTVSRVLRGSVPVAHDTRERVLKAAADLRYVPTAAASNLARKHQPALGLVLPHLVGEYYSHLLIGFELAAAELGYTMTVLLANPRTDARGAVVTLAERVEGLAFMARSAASDDLIADLAGPRAVVTVARGAVDGVPAVFSTNRRTARELVTHLLATGRRRPLFIGTPEPASDLQARHAGYLDALADAGLPPRDPIVTPLDDEAGVRVAERLLADGLDADALVCGNDLLAVCVLQVLTRAGVRVPDDVAVTGWDDIHAARFVTPTLTTVDQPVEHLARVAVAHLHAHLTGAGDPPPATTVLDSHVVHRESCCPATGSRATR